MPTTDAPPTCPTCGGGAVPVVYGLPGPGLFEAAERAEVILGGCCIVEDEPMPNWGCPSRGDEWHQHEA